MKSWPAPIAGGPAGAAPLSAVLAGAVHAGRGRSSALPGWSRCCLPWPDSAVEGACCRCVMRTVSAAQDIQHSARQGSSTLVYQLRPLANGTRTDHPVPDLPFVDDSHLPLDEGPEAIEA